MNDAPAPSAEWIVHRWGLAVVGIYVALLALLVATVPGRIARSPGDEPMLIGALDGDDECVWLDTDRGRVGVSWPPNVEVIPGAGTVVGPTFVVGPGDWIGVTGSLIVAGADDEPCAASGGDVWLVDGVTALGPRAPAMAGGL